MRIATSFCEPSKSRCVCRPSECQRCGRDLFSCSKPGRKVPFYCPELCVFNKTSVRCGSWEWLPSTGTLMRRDRLAHRLAMVSHDHSKAAEPRDRDAYLIATLDYNATMPWMTLRRMAADGTVNSTTQTIGSPIVCRIRSLLAAVVPTDRYDEGRL